MKPIYITCLHMKHGGVEKMIAALANEFAKRGYPVEILCLYKICEPVYPLESSIKIKYLTDCIPNREVFCAALKEKRLLRCLKEGVRALRTLRLKRTTLISAIKKIDDGIIISTRHEHSLLLSKYGKDTVLKIAQLHHDHGFKRKFIRDFRKKYNGIDYLALLTPQTCEEVQQIMKGYNDHTKCVAIPNFIDVPTATPAAVRKKQVIAAGRLHPDKDFSSLLQIWAQTTQKVDTDWQLVIAGEGELEALLKAEAAHLNISDRVQFVGALTHDDLLQEMAQSYCYALTSVEESFGLVLAEAMSCGTPPVSFDVRVGPRSIIDDGISGFLISLRSKEDFAERLLQLMNDEALRNQMGEAAIRKATRFFPENIMSLWAKILR